MRGECYCHSFFVSVSLIVSMCFCCYRGFVMLGTFLSGLFYYSIFTLLYFLHLCRVSVFVWYHIKCMYVCEVAVLYSGCSVFVCMWGYSVVQWIQCFCMYVRLQCCTVDAVYVCVWGYSVLQWMQCICMYVRYSVCVRVRVCVCVCSFI